VIDSAAVFLDEVVSAIRLLRASTAEEPGRLEAIEERLDALTRLQRKYGDSEAAVLAFRAAAAAELDRLAHHEEILAGQERVQDELRAELEAAAAELSVLRLTATGRLQALVEREIRALGMDRGVFRIALERTGLEGITSRGWDRVEFRLSANPGEEPKALARAASGGELSRAMLGVRAVLAEADEVPTVIFDEVDAGIGGQIAGVVGDRLAAVAARRQVLCVTHLAQIATRADHHLCVTKSVRGGRSRARVEPLEGEARVGEIARMLGGETRAALRHARELLLEARPRRR
jgi:DNA repair protein RecN (Recombination protein N)